MSATRDNNNNLWAIFLSKLTLFCSLSTPFRPPTPCSDASSDDGADVPAQGAVDTPTTMALTVFQTHQEGLTPEEFAVFRRHWLKLHLGERRVEELEVQRETTADRDSNGVEWTVRQRKRHRHGWPFGGDWSQ